MVRAAFGAEPRYPVAVADAYILARLDDQIDGLIGLPIDQHFQRNESRRPGIPAQFEQPAVDGGGRKLLAFGEQGRVLSQHDFPVLDDFAQIAMDTVFGGAGFATPGKAGEERDPPETETPELDTLEHYWKNSSSAMSR